MEALVNFMSHSLHAYGFSAAWFRRWRFADPGCENSQLHRWQTYIRVGVAERRPKMFATSSCWLLDSPETSGLSRSFWFSDSSTIQTDMVHEHQQGPSQKKTLGFRFWKGGGSTDFSFGAYFYASLRFYNRDRFISTLLFLKKIWLSQFSFKNT